MVTRGINYINIPFLWEALFTAAAKGNSPRTDINYLAHSVRADSDSVSKVMSLLFSSILNIQGHGCSPQYSYHTIAVCIDSKTPCIVCTETIGQ